MTQPDDGEFRERMDRLDRLLREADSIPDPAARERTGQIIQGVMEFHGAAVAAIVGRLGATGPAGRALLDELAGDAIVASLLLLYDLHPQAIEVRVRQALDGVRPYLASHGGSVELLAITETGTVRLRLHGSCHGCPSSAVTLKQTIEQAIYDRAPDVSAIEVEGEPLGQGDVGHEHTPRPPDGFAGFVPVEQLVAGRSSRSLTSQRV